MKKIIILLFLLWPGLTLQAQQNRAVRLFSYLPAPGQFINNPLLGTPAAAERITQSTDHLVSLGSFGGSIILGFEKPVKNDPRNPYGIDFTIFGNAFDGSSEPGVVWVMKDENGNGLPDDTWYEIAGSSSFHPGVKRNYQVTWKPLADGSIEWSDGVDSGIRTRNEFHLQPYYPQPSDFPEYPRDSITLSGTLLPLIPPEETGVIRLRAAGFGYADSHAWDRYSDLTDPDNPYTPGVVEGCGGDPVDISWAIDSEGNYVFLDQIDFVKIVTGVFAENSLLGEISPEIAAVVATAPSGKEGDNLVTLIHPHRENLYMGDSIRLYAAFFNQGRITPTEVTFSLAAGNEGMITPDGVFKALKGGQYTPEATPAGYPANSAFTWVVVREPANLELQNFSNSMMVGENSLIQPVLSDQYGMEISGTGWEISVDNTIAVSIEATDKGFIFTPLNPGTGVVTFTSTRFEDFSRSFQFTVSESPLSVRVFATALTRTSNLFPAQWITINAHSVNHLVENRSGEYGQPSFVSLAQAASVVLSTAGTGFKFRDEEFQAKGLYLYSVETDGMFTYGWGGKTDPPQFARAWIISQNNRHHLNNWNLKGVADGDTIILYHVNNILEHWNLPYLTSTPPEAKKGDVIEVSTSESEMKLTSAGTIEEVERRSLPFQPVSFRGFSENGSVTDHRGVTTLVVPEETPLFLESGVNTLVITPPKITATGQSRTSGAALFPNPATSWFRLVSGKPGPMKIRVTDMSGRVVLQRSASGAEETISISGFAPGVYLVELYSDGDLHRFQLLKR